MFTKAANSQPATRPAPGHRGAHRPQAALARIAAAASGLTTGMNGGQAHLSAGRVHLMLVPIPRLADRSSAANTHRTTTHRRSS